MQPNTNLKRLASIGVVSILACSAFADGTVQFQNNPVSRFYLYSDAIVYLNVVTSATLGSQDTSGNGYGSSGVLDVGLVWGTTSSSVSTIYGGTLAGIENMAVDAGFLSGNRVFSVTGTIPGNSYYFQVYAWDSSFGDSLAGMQACVAAGGYFGASSAGSANQTYGAVGAPLNIAVGSEDPDGIGTPLFGSSGNVFGQTIVLDAPEPTSLMLAATGAVGLLLFGRRKLMS
jgi:hypothetical protein